MPAAARALPGRRRRRRAVLYLRQSISRDDSISIEMQDGIGRDYSERNDIDIVAVVDDPNRTGRTLQRRKVQEAIGYIERGEADVIIVWKWSRLARNRRDFAVCCDLVESLGGTIESSTEPIDTTTAAGKFARGMMAEYAAFQSDQIGETWTDVHRYRRNRGLPAQGGRRFGYQLAEDGDTYTIDPVTGPVLAKMYRMWLDGAGFTKIAAWVNSLELPTTWGGTWARDRVTFVLDSGFGAGKIVTGKIVGGKRRPLADRTWLPGRHPAVITDDEWQRYLRQRQVARTPAASAEPRYMLSGWIRCEAGHPMHATALGEAPGYGYICSRWVKTGKSECRCITVSRAKAERAVAAWLAELAADVDAGAERAVAAERAREKTTVDVERVRARLAAVSTQIENLVDWGLEGRITQKRYDAAMGRLDAKEKALTGQLVELESQAHRMPKAAPSVPPALLDAWPTLPMQARRKVLAPLLARVEVHRPAEGTTRGGRSQVWIVVVSTWGAEFVYRE